jgi:AAA domain
MTPAPSANGHHSRDRDQAEIVAAMRRWHEAHYGPIAAEPANQSERVIYWRQIQTATLAIREQCYPDAGPDMEEEQRGRVLCSLLAEAQERLDRAQRALDNPNKPTWPEPVYITELSDSDASIEFLWDGCIARGHHTLLSALMKCGKTTFLGCLLRCMQRGELFLGRATKECRTLIVSEESRGLWCRRRDALGLDNHLSLLCRPMLAKPTLADWLDFVRHVGDCAAKRSCDLVVFDTISAFAPWKSENDSAEVQSTTTPFNRLLDAGRAVLSCHHIGKADGGEGRAARGSTALASAADVLLELRRYKPDDKADRRRVLSGLGRFEEVPEELVIELATDGSGYTAEGDRKAVAARELRVALLDVLPSEPPGDTATNIHSALPDGNRPARGEVMRALQAGADDGSWRREGFGKPRDPWRFWRPE